MSADSSLKTVLFSTLVRRYEHLHPELLLSRIECAAAAGALHYLPTQGRIDWFRWGYPRTTLSDLRLMHTPAFERWLERTVRDLERDLERTMRGDDETLTPEAFVLRAGQYQALKRAQAQRAGIPTDATDMLLASLPETGVRRKKSSPDVSSPSELPVGEARVPESRTLTEELDALLRPTSLLVEPDAETPDPSLEAPRSQLP